MSKIMCAFNRNAMTLSVGLLLSLCAAPMASESDAALSRLAVIALAPLDGQAVVKLPGGTMRIVRQGELIPGTEATILQVLPDRLVVSHRTATSGEVLAWLHQAPAHGGFSRVMYWRHHIPRQKHEQVSQPHHPVATGP